MKMKKIISTILMSSIIALSFAGCSSSDNASNGAQSGLIEDGKLYVATSPDYPPFEYMEDGELAGFDIELIQNIAEEAGLEIEFGTLDFENVISAVQAGQYDVGVSGFSENPERQVLFSDPYYVTAQVALLPLDSEITSASQLEGGKLGAGLGTTAQPTAEELSDDVTLVPTSTGFPMLLAGQIEAYICDSAVAESAAATGKYKVLDEPLTEEAFCIIFEENNQALADNVNAILVNYMETEEYQELLDKYGL